MFSAKEARSHAESVKNKVAEVDHLSNHFEQLIRKASNSGKFTIDKQTFQNDRFSPETVQEVMERLKTNGYRVDLTTNNAQQTMTFNISW